jgi:hypothetical protein
VMSPTPNSCVLYDVHVRIFVTFLVILIAREGRREGHVAIYYWAKKKKKTT